jgi:hypothetical protein
MATSTIRPVRSSPVRDTYKFGDGPDIVLRPGTMGWTASEMEDPVLRGLWDEGRFEILDGVLTITPAAFFLGGQSALELLYLAKRYLRKKKIPAQFSTEVDIQVSEPYLLRADAVAVFGDDLPKFRALKFKKGDRDWRKHALIIAPTLVIESVSKGHETHDRQSKRKWYADFGVRHYWIVDAYARSLECWFLKDGAYIADGAGTGADNVPPASLPGLKLPLTEVWGDDE